MSPLFRLSLALALVSSLAYGQTPQNSGIGTATPGSKLEIKAANCDSTKSALNVKDSCGTSLFFVRNDGRTGIGLSAPQARLHIKGLGVGNTYFFRIDDASNNTKLYFNSNGEIGLNGGFFATQDLTNKNVRVGYGSAAMNGGSSNIANTAIGYEAGASDNSGGDNVFVGYRAGFNTTSSSVTFIGHTAGLNNSTGTDNTFVGKASGYNNTSGSQNTIVGRSAGVANTIGTENTFIGYQAGKSNTTASNNTFLGVSAGEANTTGTQNTLVGQMAGNYLTTGSDNVALGRHALVGTTTTGGNIAIGMQALSGTNTGGNNIAIGTQSGMYVTSGTNNTFMGSGIITPTTGVRNTIIGTTLGSTLTSGSDNTFLGFQTGQNIVTGSKNLFLGAYVRTSGADISSSIGLGWDVDIKESNQMVIGSISAKISDVYIGQGVTRSGDPSDLSIQSTGGSGTDIQGSNLILAAGKSTGSATPASLIFSTSSVGTTGNTLQSLSERMRINGSNGYVGIGTSSPSAQLHTTGSIRHETLAGTGSRMVVADASGNLSTQAVPGALPSGTSNQTLRYDGSNWVASSLLTNNGSLIGIGTGTTTPAAQLHAYASTGTATNKIFQAGSSTVSDAFYVQENGYLFLNQRMGINTNNSTLVVPLQIGNTEDWAGASGGKAIYINDDNTGTSAVYLGLFNNNAAYEPNFNLYKGRGTFSSKSALQSGDDIGSVNWNGYDGSNRKNLIKVGGQATASDKAKWFVKISNGGSLAEQLTLLPSGQFGIGTATPNSSFEVNGSVGYKVVSKTSNYTAADEAVILADASSGNITINLPAASTVNGRTYIIKKNTSSNQVIIDANGSETIDDAATKTLSAQYSKITIISDGSNWFVIED